MAWREVRALLSEGDARDRRVITGVREADIQRREQFADTMYGAQKFGRDVTQPLIIPNYVHTPPHAPEHGFRLIYVDGMPMRLWHDGAWVELSGELLRRIESSGLRTALAVACVFQERRHWRSAYHTLVFRDHQVAWA